MKQLIVPIAIIVALIAFFVIIDRKEFSRHDDVQTVQSESLTTNGKPTVSDLGTKSVTEVKPVVETKQETDAKQVNTQSSSSESIDRQTDRQTGTPLNEGKIVPAAVSVVTAEEAKKLNEDAKAYALAEKEKREPFYRCYQDTKLDSVCFRGTIRATSAIPDPEKNDYDDCLYALLVEIDALLSDVTADTEIAREIIVNIPIMKNKIILQDNKFLPGDMVLCTCAEYDAMPQEIQEIQLSDDIQSYEHQQYYSLIIQKIAAFQVSKGGNRNFAKREITVLPLQTIPKDEKAANARKGRIQNEIFRIEEEIKKHGGSFESWKEEYKPIIEKYKTFSNKNFKGWIKDSYFATGIGEPNYSTQEYIDGILPYKNYFEENNIDLIIVRIPNKWEFARCVLASDDFQENPAWVEHYYNCLKNDIEIVDPMPAMWEHRFDFPLFYFYNEPSEFHPFEGQAFVSAMVLSDVLRRYSFSKSEKPIELEDYVFKTTETRYFWPEGNVKYDPKENISFKRVIRDDLPLGALEVNTGSPFLFLSNSFFWYPYRPGGASVPAYTAFFIQHVPDWFYQGGIGNPMIRNLVSNPQALSNRKVVIMVGHPNNWINSFPSFPRYITDKARCISLENSLDFQSFDITILDNGSFLFEKAEDNVTSFSQNTEMDNPNKYFDILMSVPSVIDKGTCMLRINFGINSDITTVVSDKNTKDIIDQTTLSPGKNLHTDFYIPVADGTRQISIRFAPSYPDKQFSIKNIEFWYY